MCLVCSKEGKDICDQCIKEAMSDKQKYPIGGYAPGSYSCRCVSCKEQFMGDKRAVQCEPCAIEATNKYEAKESSGLIEYIESQRKEVVINPNEGNGPELLKYFEDKIMESNLKDDDDLWPPSKKPWSLIEDNLHFTDCDIRTRSRMKNFHEACDYWIYESTTEIEEGRRLIEHKIIFHMEGYHPKEFKFNQA